MEIILLKDMNKLGKEGDVVKVNTGYARNYLIPNKIAAISSPASLQQLETMKKKRESRERKEKEQALEISKKIESLSCTIPVEAGVEDKIFGAITSEMIRNVLRNDNIEVDKKQITIEEEIKKLGVYDVKVKLHPEVVANIRVWVVKK